MNFDPTLPPRTRGTVTSFISSFYFPPLPASALSSKCSAGNVPKRMLVSTVTETRKARTPISNLASCIRGISPGSSFRIARKKRKANPIPTMPEAVLYKGMSRETPPPRLRAERFFSRIQPT
jgi:hypothetical protein